MWLLILRRLGNILIYSLFANSVWAGSTDLSANITGDDNDIYITQANGRHVIKLEVQDSSNEITLLQQRTNLMTSHYLESLIIGSNNTVNIQQPDSGKTAFENILGN